MLAGTDEWGKWEEERSIALYLFFDQSFFFFLQYLASPAFLPSFFFYTLSCFKEMQTSTDMHICTCIHTHTPSDYVRWFISLCTFSSQIILFSCTSGVSCSPEIKLSQTFHSSEMWKPPFPISQLCSYVDLVFGIFLTHRKAIFELRLDYTKMDCIH